MLKFSYCLFLLLVEFVVSVFYRGALEKVSVKTLECV